MSETWVEDYRRALGIERNGEEAPLTFVSCLRDSEFCAFASLELKLSQLLHAGQHYKFHRPLRAGDWVTSQTTITRCAKKSGKSGAMVFIDFTNEFRLTTPSADDEDWAIGEKIAESVMTVIVKESE